MFRLQHASGERMVAMFTKVVKKILNRNPSNRLMPMELWFVFVGNWNVWSQCGFFLYTKLLDSQSWIS